LDYILKFKINKDIIVDLLQQVMEDLNSRCLQTKGVLSVQSAWEIDSLRNSLFIDIISGKCSKGSWERIRELGTELHEDTLWVAYIISDFEIRIQSKPYPDEKLFCLTIRDLIKDICNEFFSSYCFQYKDGKYIIVFSAKDTEDSKRSILLMFETVTEMLKKYSGINASIGISLCTSGYGKLRDAYLQAKDALNCLFVEGYGKVLFYKHQTSGVKQGMNINFYDKDQIYWICELADDEAFVKLMKQVMEELKNHCFIKDNACVQCSRFICLIEDGLGEEWRDYKSKSTNNYINILYYSQTIDEIIRALKRFMDDIKIFMNDKKKDATFRLVKDAKQYIREHVMDTITLKDVAFYLHISTGYLSGIFSKYEPKGFANYVNFIKIMEAKKLLKQERLKIYEVSFQLGYENSGYFSKIFKKYAGCTPREFIEM